MPTQVWTEYKVIQLTSALSFMIAGTVKEIITGKCAARDVYFLLVNKQKSHYFLKDVLP